MANASITVVEHDGERFRLVSAPAEAAVPRHPASDVQRGPTPLSPSRSSSGAGRVARLPDLLRTLGARRALLVTTAGRLASPDGRAGRGAPRPLARVDVRRGHARTCPTPTVQAALLQARRDAIDAVVSFGGGSCADLGKAVCFFLEQEAGMPGASHIDRPAVAHLSIPTTYSGAELTPFFGMTDPATGQKQGAGGPTSAPLIVDLRPGAHAVHARPGERGDRA